MKRLAILVLLPAAALVAPASAAKPAYCTEKGIVEVLAASDEDAGAGIAQIACGDVTGDGRRDAVFTILSGGTAGPTQFGVISKQGGLLLLKDGFKISIDRVNGKRFDVQQPIYAKDDANCCPSAFRFTRYVWDGERFKARKGPKYTRAKTRFFG